MGALYRHIYFSVGFLESLLESRNSPPQSYGVRALATCLYTITLGRGIHDAYKRTAQNFKVAVVLVDVIFNVVLW